MRKSFRFAENLFAEHGGILRTSEAMRLGIDRKTLSDMTKAGLLVKEEKGIYRLSSFPTLAFSDFVVVALHLPYAVVCLISALHYHGLTTQIPQSVHIAIPRRKRLPRLAYPPLSIVTMTDRPYSSGIEIHHLDGVPVKIYSKEKTIADCFKFRNKLGQSIALEALKIYLEDPSPNVSMIMSYAKIDRVANIIRPYIQASL